MPNVRYTSRFESSLYAYSQEKIHVIFKDRRKILLYMVLSRRKLLVFYIN
jgi:hypothetical protein